jgi:CubicO group peptidase (beta-lactamase class C family)
LSRSKETSDIEAKVDNYVKPFLGTRSFSGAVLIAKGGQVLMSKGYGMANYELDVPNTPQTKFHLASISKPFTAAAIMILEERGQLKVTDPLTKFIPDYPNGDKITIHQLLIHTSGIANANDFPDYNDKSKFPQTTESLVAMFKNKPLTMQPGERFSYSNSNYNVLAFIIEKLSGKSYGEFLKENIFDPAGMKDTGHDGNPAKMIKNRASGYVPVGVSEIDNAPYLDWTIKTGNGSLYSTVEDLYKFDRALYTEKILKKSTLEKVFTAHVSGVCYGWFRGNRLNRQVIRMSGRSPGFQGEIQRYVNDDACVIVLSNNYSGTASLIINDLAAILFGEKYEAPHFAKSFEVDPKIASELVGTYQGGQDFIRQNAILSVQNRNNQLLLVWSPTAISGLIPLSDGRFFDRMFGGMVSFARDEKGAVNRLIWYSGGDYVAMKTAK